MPLNSVTSGLLEIPLPLGWVFAADLLAVECEAGLL